MGPAALALLPAALDFAGGAVSAWSTSRENRRQRDWQTYMSNTAYRRSVTDMRAAGLNPLLMMGRGGEASTPSGGVAGIPGEAIAQGISRASSSAKAWMRQRDEMRLLREEVMNAQKTGRMLQAQQRKADSEADLTEEELRRLVWDSTTVMAPRARAEIANMEANSANALANASLTSGKARWLTPATISSMIRDVLVGLTPFGRLVPGRKVLRPRTRR